MGESLRQEIEKDPFFQNHIGYFYGDEIITERKFATLNQYCTEMAKPPTVDENGVINDRCYGGQLEIMTAIKKYGEGNLQVIVHHYKGETLLAMNYPEESKENVIHLLLQEGHYDLLVEET